MLLMVKIKLASSMLLAKQMLMQHKDCTQHISKQLDTPPLHSYVKACITMNIISDGITTENLCRL